MKKVILTVLTLATVFVGCNKNEIEGLERDLALEKTYNRGLRNEVNNLSASLETANMSISDLEAVVTDAERQISSLNADLELGAAEKAQLIADYDVIIADAEARIDELTVSLADALAQIEDLIANPIVIVRYREVVRTVIEVVERVVVETVIGDQAAIDALNVTIDALNARIAELEADTTNTDLIAELRLTISALESQLANIDTTAPTGVVTGTIVFYIDGDLNRADGAERYFQTLDLVKFALGTNIVAPETSYDIYTIIENDGVYSGAELLITLVSTYVAPSQGQVDNDGDGFAADVDLDDADASIGDAAAEAAKAAAPDTLGVWSTWAPVDADKAAPTTQEFITEERTRSIIQNGDLDTVPPTGDLSETRQVDNPVYEAPVSNGLDQISWNNFVEVAGSRTTAPITYAYDGTSYANINDAHAAAEAALPIGTSYIIETLTGASSYNASRTVNYLAVDANDGLTIAGEDGNQYGEGETETVTRPIAASSGDTTHTTLSADSTSTAVTGDASISVGSAGGLDGLAAPSITIDGADFTGSSFVFTAGVEYTVVVTWATSNQTYNVTFTEAELQVTNPSLELTYFGDANIN